MVLPLAIVLYLDDEELPTERTEDESDIVMLHLLIVSKKMRKYFFYNGKIVNDSHDQNDHFDPTS